MKKEIALDGLGVAMTDIQVAQILGLKPSTLRKWRNQGRGPRWHSYGRSVRYVTSEVAAWQQAQPSGGGQVEKQ